MNRLICELEQLVDNQTNENLQQFDNIEDFIELVIEDNLILQEEQPHLNATHKKISEIRNNGEVSEISIKTSQVLYGQSVIRTDDSFICAGGASLSGLCSKSIYVFKLDGEFSKEGFLKQERKFPACVYNEGVLFVIGGQDSRGKSLITIEVFDKFLNFLYELNMINEREFPSACIFGGFLCVASAETLYIERYKIENISEEASSENYEFQHCVISLCNYENNLAVFYGEGLAVLNEKFDVIFSVRTSYTLTWMQSPCGVFEDIIYYTDYFTRKLNRIKLEISS